MEKFLPQGRRPLLRPLVLLLSVLLLLGGAACKKIEETFPVDEQKMPAATQEGKGTFGCLVGGKLWLPYIADGSTSAILLGAYRVKTNNFTANSPSLTIDAVNERPTAEVQHLTLSLGATSAIVPGVYTLSNGLSASARGTGATPGNSELYNTANGGGSATLTIIKVEPVTNTVNGITTRSIIVAGTFQFTARGQSGKTIAVTDGRFDLGPVQ